MTELTRTPQRQTAEECRWEREKKGILRGRYPELHQLYSDVYHHNEMKAQIAEGVQFFSGAFEADREAVLKQARIVRQKVRERMARRYTQG